MKNGKFETQAEIYQALLDGKAVTNCYMILNLVDGHPCYYGTTIRATLTPFCLRSNRERYSFNAPEEWSLYEEPREQIKIVAHLCDDGEVYLSLDSSRYCVARDENDDYKRIELTPEMFGWKGLEK
jgi:hypothetical protein